ncbi:RloB family protein [Micromonospora parva]|uniref:RloB family protein n=1 Tax=Micromonospora parva TaxID=1464048 RepID=UPI0033C4B979
MEARVTPRQGNRQAADSRSGRGRETDLRRRASTREQRTTVLIATNGESTERAYFNGLKQEAWVRPRVVVVAERGSPVNVVRGAARRRQRDDFDEAWAVCDVDEFATEQAAREAVATDVRLAWSNPCFEVWLLLHYSNHTGFVENAKRARDLLREHNPAWDKTALDFANFRDRIEDACRRADRLDPSPEGNPSTSVGQIIAALRDDRARTGK